MNSIPESASDHLKVIRSLMERATVYRAISAPAALFGGILAIAAGGWIAWNPGLGGNQFYWVWLGILALVGGYNALLLFRQAKARGEPFFSSGMRLAMRAILPPLAAGGLLSWWFLFKTGAVTVCVGFWVIFYGLALLAAGSFAPSSMRALGAVFFGSGFGLFLALLWYEVPAASDMRIGALIMAATFGLFHLAYALKIFRSTEKDASADIVHD